MNVVVLLAIIAVMVALRFLKPNALAWAAAIWVAVYVGLRYAVEPPVPASVTSMFMFIVTLALAVYISTTDERLHEVKSNVVAFLTEKRFTIPLIVVLIGLPALVAFRVYLNVTSSPAPPASGRTIHPPPPVSITLGGRTIDLSTEVNPFRELETSDPDAFAEHVSNGRHVYYTNCHYCHGDDMRGDGLFAHGFDPIPADFQDPTTIAMLQESYLFWRIAKGGPGLPVESTPWSSAMPAWETFLTEEEIWDVVLFLYDFTDQRPRAREDHE